MFKFLRVVNFERLKEPSTYAGLGVLVMSVFPVTPAEYQAYSAGFAGIMGVLAALTRDRGSAMKEREDNRIEVK